MPEPAKDGGVRSAQPQQKPAQEETAALPPDDKASGPEAVSQPTQPASPPPPSACQLRLTPDLAAVQALPTISAGPCAAEDVVRLDAVVAREGQRIAITPPATLRCPMAETVVHWIREDVAAVASDFGAPLRSVTVDTSYECRSRNRVAGAKLSEHGHANAVDLRSITLVNGVVIRLTDALVRKDARERLRDAACARFTTVLGPGSDGYHEDHVHLDLAERRSGYRICQWAVRDPTMMAAVPFPPERPTSAPPRSGRGANSSSRD